MAVELAGSLGAVALFAVPGYGLTELLPPLRRLPPARRAGYGYLLGVAAVCGTLYAVSHLGGIPLRAPAVWTAAALPALAGLLAAALRWAARQRDSVSQAVPAVPAAASLPDGRPRSIPAAPGTAAAPVSASAPATASAAWSAPAVWRRRLGGPLRAACVLVAALVCCGLLAEAASDPVHDWDGRMTWTAQARYIRAAGTVDAEALRNGRWYVSHPQYPLLLPIAQAAALEAFGAGPDSHLQRAVYAAFFPALLLLVYDGARRGAGRTVAALAVAAAAGVPFFAFGEGGAFSTYSDLPLACFYGAAVLLLLAPRPDLAGGLAAGLLLAAAALTKNEGALLALLALALGWRPGAGPRRVARPHEAPAGPGRSRRRAALRVAAAALPLALALALLASWRSAIPDRQDENYPDLVKEIHFWPDAVTHVAVFVPVMWRQMTRFHHWTGFWWMAPVVLLAGRHALRRPRNRRLLAAAAGPPAIAWAAYSVHSNPGFLASVTWERFLLQGAVPLLILLACALAEVGRHLPGRQPWIATAGLVRLSLSLSLFVGAACSSAEAPPPLPVAPGLVSNLFDAAQSAERSASPEVEALVSGDRKVARSDPRWPTITFLAGEINRRRGDAERARAAFSELASWATSGDAGGPHADTWGGSGLAGIGLWRWLQILDQRGPQMPDEVGRVLDVAAKLRETRLYSGMVRSELLPGLPLIAEDVAHRLAHVAWKDQRQDLARSLYLDFLGIDSGGELDDVDRQIQAQLLERGLATRQRLDLLRARRRLALVKTKAQKDQAAATLEKLWDDRKVPADVRAEAGYEWADYMRRENNPKVVAVLTEIVDMPGDQPVAAKALYRRGMLQGDDASVAALHELKRRFPRSPLTQDALFQVATDFLFRPDPDRALLYYRQLRDLPPPNDYQDSAYYLPAMGLVGRSHGNDLDVADRLLADYLKLYPNGTFRLRSLFWRGRIAESKRDLDRARSFFQQVAGEAPYDYYGLRARLHLDEGVKAISQHLPAAGSRTRAALNQAFRGSRFDPALAGRSPFHERLAAAASTGLYQRLLAAELSTQRRLGKRLDDISLQDLDELGLTASVALLLALRQDALAAKDFDSTADNWLRLAGLLGHQLQDWPTALEAAFVPATAAHERLTELQADPRYLATVYPDPADLPALRQALAGAAWADAHGSTHVSQSLMYALIRQESRFYAGAISRVGAVGLFQIMPQAFASFDKRSRLRKESGAASDVQYLLDPRRNIATWAAWWKPQLAKQDIAVAIMEHNAGAANVSKWMSTYWAKMGPRDDLEYRVETVRFPETRSFLRKVLQDTTIFDAAGFFDRSAKN
jgi:TolA-binding protein